MPEELAARCPNCSQDVAVDAAFCPSCGSALRPAPASPGPGSAPTRSGAYRFLRLLFVTWLIAYPVLGCGSMLLGASVGSGGASMALVSGAILGLAFLIPWLIGLAVLGLLLFVTR